MRNTIIMGAAGRDFHNFLIYFKENHEYNVVCFTAQQIPGIADRVFPKELAGEKYPEGIPIIGEEKLPEIIKSKNIDLVCLSYSDLSHNEVMHKASIVLSSGANFILLGAKDTQLKAKVPVIAVTAVRTGAGKSPVSRKVAQILKEEGYEVAAVRHPMPYGDLLKQRVQLFRSYEDLEKYNCTIEEREEYEPWIEFRIPIYAGVDYASILKEAESSDVIVWDGGNNDMPFYRPDLSIVITDALRPGHEILYHPGETNLRAADIIVINKSDIALKKNIEEIKSNIKMVNRQAQVVLGKLSIHADNQGSLKNKKVLIVGDGPTLTHGNMSYGAGTVLARKMKSRIEKPVNCAVGSLRKTMESYPHLKDGTELPAMGYSKEQIRDLEASINKSKAEIVIDSTPVNLSRLLKINKKIVVADYFFEEVKTDIIQKCVKELMMKFKTKKEDARLEPFHTIKAF